MATQYVYPISTSNHAWTPSSGGTNHALLLDEDPPNETDTITVNGFGGGDIDRFTFDPGVAGTISAVRGIVVEIHLSGTQIVNVPALKIIVYLSGGIIYQKDTYAATSGFDDLTLTLPPQNILGSTWYAGPIEVSIMPINGSVGYEPSLGG